ncbi:DUF427-domain-containing protein [Punctularia strigosozonata HHB-11173 SS5]|uniref:DUF427-domain-containing protein n=1 Tax=Punctularia strigosozonata (strain HHB-11173) TaxID=741275 RepID=UPI00044179FB|nr:DUF427-domain-containing protein [Punctularia strigosozonata HHB-11173 SS5]EIN12625.1 DUF427-domain-containing protein [Punctularia strigosozonata HHB-11173 SS5]
MVKVELDGTLLAESDATVVVEGNHYFPRDAIKTEYFNPSNTHTTCPWKGYASYYNASVNGKEVKDIAWYYPETKEKANNIKDYVAFYKVSVDIIPLGSYD